MNPNHCLVTQNIAALIADRPEDLDRYPDIANVYGSVTFTPTMASGQAYHLTGEDGKDFTVPITPVTASIKNGRIEHEGEPGVYLFAAGENTNPQSIVYRAVYSNLYAGTDRIALNLNTVTFEAVPGGVVDLTTVTPVAGTPSPGIAKGDKGDTGEQGPQGERGPQGEVGPRGSQGEPGEVTLAQLNQAIRVDTSVGTRVFAGDTMIFGDTGLRRLARWDNVAVDIPDALKDFGPSDTNLTAYPGGIWIRRKGDLVTLSVAYAKSLKDNPEIRPSPAGFGSTTGIGVPYPSGPLGYAVGSTYYFSTVEAGLGFFRFRIPKDAAIRSPGAGGYGVEISWHTREPWPTTLPGTPA